MTKHILALSMMLVASLAGSAQYFGTPVYKAGFDNETEVAQWTSETTPDAGVTDVTNASSWSLGNSASPSFSQIDRSSKASLAVKGGTAAATVTYTSAPIDLSGKSNLRVGFYALDLKSTVSQYTFLFSVSCDNGATWTNLFSSKSSTAWTGLAPVGWNAFKFALPTSCNGKSVLLRFSMAGKSAYGSGPAYIDGVFISEVPEVDLAVTGAKFADNKAISTDFRKPSYKALTNSEAIKVDIKNEGSASISDATVTLSVNDEEVASETITKSIAPGATYTHTFATKADLSEARGEFEIAVNIDADGDAISTNNDLTFYAENTVTNIPYTPDFVGEADYDNWVAYYNEDGMAEWSGNSPRNGSFFWNIFPEDEDGYLDACDAWLVSRPVQLEAGKTYRVEFAAWTASDGDPNTLVVEYGHSEECGVGTSIWTSSDITEDNSKNVSFTFTVPADDPTPEQPYYFIFHCKSVTTAGELRLSNIKFSAYSLTDAALTAITAPAANAMRYSAAEPVTVTVANNGTTELNSGNTTVSYSINDGTPVTEALTSKIAGGASTQFTFAAKADMSELGKTYCIKAWVTTAGDTGVDNNSVSVNAVSQVVTLPHVPDFGNASAAADETSYWTVKDNNNDGYTFTCSYDKELNKRIWSTGGGLYGTETVTVNAINEQLESRKFAAAQGAYKLSFKTCVGKPGASVPMNLTINSYDENGAVLGQPINIDGNATATGVYFTQQVHNFNIPAEGIYSIAFNTALNEAADFRLYLSDIRILPASAVDLAVEEIIIPTTAISTIKEMPVGVTVRNDGENTVNSFTLTAVGLDGTVSQTFENAGLEPNASYEVYFTQPVGFTQGLAERSTLSVSIATEGDACAANNALSVDLTERPVATAPYNPEPQFVMGEWMTFNNNRDAFRFRPDRRVGQGYLYQAPKGVEANDVLASTAIALEKDKNYAFSISYMVNEGDSTSFRVSAYDAATDTEHILHTVVGATQSSTMSRITRHFSLPADGNYNICITPVGEATSLFVSASMSVTEVAALPDLKIVSIQPKATEAVFSNNETVVVNIQNTGAAALQSVPVTLTVGDKVYHALHARPVDKESEAFAVVFNGVDLYAPGNYNLLANAPAVSDANPANNSMELTVISLPVVDVNFEEMTSPVSGELLGEQPVEVVVSNLGKGMARNIALECRISSEVLAEEIVLQGQIDSIAEATSTHYIFDRKINMDAPGDYAFNFTLAIDGNAPSKGSTMSVNVTSSAKPLDGGVTAITNPVDGILSAAEKVTVTVKNYSEVTINEVPVKAVVKLGDKTVATISGAVKKIAVGESVDYTFETPVDMSAQGTYTIEASTAIANDIDTSNDAVSTSVKCLIRDLGVTAIISPTIVEAEGTQDVTIEITNFGEAPVGNFEVSYQIGAMPQRATVAQTIQPGEKLEFTFPTKHEFVIVKDYTIKARTLLPEDYNTANDACEAIIQGFVAGIDKLAVEASVTIEDGILTVKAESAIKKVEIFTVAGQLIASESNADSNTVNIDLKLVSGIYVAKVTTDKGTAAFRFVAK